MSEQTSSKVPQIRFNGFEGEWEGKTLGALGRVAMNKRVFKHQTSETGEVPFYKIGTFGKEPDSFISRKLFEEYKSKFSYPRKGDLLISAAGSIGRIVEYSGEDEYFQDSNIVWLQHDGAVVNGFLKQFYSFVKWAGLEGSTIKRLYNKNILETRIVLPEKEEQTKIGEYFRELDSLIGLHQRKHDKLVTLKKAMLQKMFPQAGATTPEIRFKGFEGDWVEKKLGDLTVNIGNNTLSRANLNSRSGSAKNIHYGDILVKYGEVLDIRNDCVPFISDDALVNKLKHSRLQDGDVVIADAAEDEMVGKCTEIHNVRDQLVLAGLHTIALHPLNYFAPFYFGYFLNADAFHNQLLRLMQGTKVLSVSKTVIKETIVYFPTDIVEQQKIGTYFRTLDALITQHATQLKKLQQIKSACLEKMFV